ncbi:MAG: hypothetical protein R2852_08390 [Bacteroidia bacterium]
MYIKIGLLSTLMLLFISINDLNGQNSKSGEKYGKTLNLGLGIGYYGYIGSNVPVLHADLEFDVAKQFTLAPSISFFSYRNSYYWGNKNYPNRYYNYSQTVIPVGVKGTYYFDNLVNAGSKWDFYFAGTLGVAIIKSTWDDGYYGDRYIYRNSYRNRTPLFLDVHVGTEYHLSNRAGLFLDLSTGISTLGLALHF